MTDNGDPRQLESPSSWSWTTPECCSVSLFTYLKSWRQFKALRSAIWFFCGACHKLEVDIYYLARSGVDLIETGWNLSLEKPVGVVEKRV
jgi:hypothetical protein